MQLRWRFLNWFFIVALSKRKNSSQLSKTMSAISKTFARFTCGTALLLAAVLFAGSCSSMDKPASASFASVVIVNQTPEQIRQAVFTVFQDNGYQTIPQSDATLVFQREATRREQIDYAGFAGAQAGEKVAIRVRVNVWPKNLGAYWVGCKAYAVCNPGQGVFENTTALFDFQSKPYQKLMDQVAQRVVMSTPAP